MQALLNPKKGPDKKIYYEGNGFLVSEKNLKTPRKTYRIGRIEKISLRRDPFFFAMGLSFLLFMFYLSFDHILYDGERIAIWCLIGFLVLSTFNVGILMVESKALSDVAAMGKLGVLRAVREAVETAIDERPERDDF